MSLADDIRKLVDGAKQGINNQVRSLAIEMQTSMVEMVPVDTGRLKNNFQCGIGSINTDTSAPPDKNGNTSIAATKAALKDWKPGDTIYLTNSLPYAHVIEYGLYGKPPGSANGEKTVGGYSRQAPNGFARVTVQRYQNYTISPK